MDILMKSLTWCGHWFHEIIHHNMKDTSDNGKKATGWVMKNKVFRDPWNNSQVLYFHNLTCYWLSTLTRLGLWYIDISFWFTTAWNIKSWIRNSDLNIFKKRQKTGYQFQAKSQRYVCMDSLTLPYKGVWFTNVLWMGKGAGGLADGRFYKLQPWQTIRT